MLEQARQEKTNPLTAERAVNARLAAALHRITRKTTTGDPVHQLATKALDGRIHEFRTEFAVLWHGDGSDNAVRLSEAKIGSLSEALWFGKQKVGQYGITRFTVQMCQHVAFTDGSVWISPWDNVDHRGPLIDCIACGQSVFRANSFDGVGLFLVDADPVVDGELTLIPADTLDGQPCGVYGKDPVPGVPRYRRHDLTCRA